MAPAARKPASQAEVSLLALKNCLVNLPASMVALLANANTAVQDVVVELNWRQNLPSSGDGDKPTSMSRSVFVGWTGYQSRNKISPVIGRDGFSSGRDQDVPQVEMDGTFARLLGLNGGEKVGIQLHADPPQAHTINVEPLTAADWEMIELHAQFLELNFLQQVRALPNPGYAPPNDGPRQPPHPVTLHLSPTSTVNVVVTSLAPAPPLNSAFVKISADAEVIVAPKTRNRPEYASSRSRGSGASVGRRSTGGRSGASTVRHRSQKGEESSRGVVFLRGVDRSCCSDHLKDEGLSANDGLTVWVDNDSLLTRALKGAKFVSVALVRPAGLVEPVDPSKEQDAERPASKVIASIRAWEDAVDSNHVAMSTVLCKTLACEGIVGGLVRLEAAPAQISRHAATASGSSASSKIRRQLRVLPFPSPTGSKSAGLRFGGESKQGRDESAQRLRALFGKEAGQNRLLDGPLTHGMVLSSASEEGQGWFGGIVKFEPPPSSSGHDSVKSSPAWILGSDWNPSIEVLPEVSRPTDFFKSWTVGEPISKHRPEMVGIDLLNDELYMHLLHSSSVLLTGGAGAGKTHLAFLLAHDLRDDHFYHITYFPCRTLATNDTRPSRVKDTLNRLFGSAAWGARLGGKSLIILDDLDRLCPAETELQVGDENGRSRQISESLCSAVRQYCTPDSGVVLLATAQSKEAVNNVVVGGHVVREIVSLKAPDKDGRRKVLEMLVKRNSVESKGAPLLQNGEPTPGHSRNVSVASASSRSDAIHGTVGMAASDQDGFVVDKHIDFLDVAGQTDGYMPGDLVLLVSRARSEALIRTLSHDDSAPENASVSLNRVDFTAAIKGFTPASLRNVTLQHSTTKWSSIGGLTATRQALMETLQYPTTYAPIFSACPLRLRSGLLLYGYPGCGKTLLASAVAGECGLNFISVKGPEILNKYIGASEKSVRDLFERAQAARPCVLFFDEFDAIAPKRGHDSTGVTDRVVNQLLTQMDGAEGLSGVYVLAATSRPDLIDPALLRPGRLDKSLVCEMPDYEERMDILKAVGAKVRFSNEVRGLGLQEVAKRTEGYSGADLQAVVYNAQLEAIHDALGANDDVSSSEDSKPKVNGTSSQHRRSGSRGATPDFVYFRYGDKENAIDNADGTESSSKLADRVKIAQQLAAVQAARRKEKQQRQQQQQQFPSHPRPTSSHFPHARPLSSAGAAHAVENDTKDAAGTKEPTIEWDHLRRGFESTRASISPEERKRLARIYREFVEGRTGELPSGQGGTEIGGRASLM